MHKRYKRRSNQECCPGKEPRGFLIEWNAAMAARRWRRDGEEDAGENAVFALEGECMMLAGG